MKEQKKQFKTLVTGFVLGGKIHNNNSNNITTNDNLKKLNH
ncbi:hypothetical protein [Cytobacillus citreus]|nr:hypothetical protein [Cytobacillus citreus]